ncbi:unnamed protein product, partial [Discosporangium mesarthrocarpum]
MGAKYSTGAVSPEWRGWLENCASLEVIRAIYLEFRRLCSQRLDDDGFFVSVEDFREVFAEMADHASLSYHHGNTERPRQGDNDRKRRLYLDKCFACFDVLERGQVPAGVLFGGLALMTGAGELGKVRFVLGMYDTDRDGKVNETELLMAMSACSSGFCRLHGIAPVPEEVLRSITVEAFLHQVRIPPGEGAHLGQSEALRSCSTAYANYTSISTSATGPPPGNSVGTGSAQGGEEASLKGNKIPEALSPDEVADFCRANAPCRNFLKNVGSTASADLILLYQHEHELLRELAEIDSALDAHEQLTKAGKDDRATEARERGGDVKNMVVHETPLRKLATKWGADHLLTPEAIEELLSNSGVKASKGGQGS